MTYLLTPQIRNSLELKKVEDFLRIIKDGVYSEEGRHYFDNGGYQLKKLGGSTKLTLSISERDALRVSTIINPETLTKEELEETLTSLTKRKLECHNSRSDFINKIIDVFPVTTNLKETKYNIQNFFTFINRFVNFYLDGKDLSINLKLPDFQVCVINKDKIFGTKLEYHTSFGANMLYNIEDTNSPKEIYELATLIVDDFVAITGYRKPKPPVHEYVRDESSKKLEEVMNKTSLESYYRDMDSLIEFIKRSQDDVIKVTVNGKIHAFEFSNKGESAQIWSGKSATYIVPLNLDVEVTLDKLTSALYRIFKKKIGDKDINSFTVEL